MMESGPPLKIPLSALSRDKLPGPAVKARISSKVTEPILCGDVLFLPRTAILKPMGLFGKWVGK